MRQAIKLLPADLTLCTERWNMAVLSNKGSAKGGPRPVTWELEDCHFISKRPQVLNQALIQLSRARSAAMIKSRKSTWVKNDDACGNNARHKRPLRPWGRRSKTMVASDTIGNKWTRQARAIRADMDRKRRPRYGNMRRVIALRGLGSIRVSMHAASLAYRACRTERSLAGHPTSGGARATTPTTPDWYNLLRDDDSSLSPSELRGPLSPHYSAVSGQIHVLSYTENKHKSCPLYDH